MSQTTSIKWTDVTWNPVRGCTRVSEGCRYCYAETMAARFSDPGYWGEGFAKRTAAGGRWTGKVALVPEKLAEPLAWRTPRRCFVNSTSDLFHEALSFEEIAAVYGVMAACPQATFQVLTKRPERRREFMSSRIGLESIAETVAREASHRAGIIWDARGPAPELYPAGRRADSLNRRRPWPGWPLPNVWEGTSVEDQATADSRIPELLATPAAVRFLSMEPLLGPVDLRTISWGPAKLIYGAIRDEAEVDDWRYWCKRDGGLSWVIVGGESGHGARPMHPDWPNGLRDQCRDAGVPFFFKQWGEWVPASQIAGVGPITHAMTPAGKMATFDRESMIQVCPETLRWEGLRRAGKKAAGRLLDGQEYSMFPGDTWEARS